MNNGIDGTKRQFGYGYDNIGNRTTAREVAETTAYETNRLNQYTSITKEKPPFIPEHDEEGNQTLLKTTTGIWTVIYNAENRPVSFTKTEGENTSMVECGYDYMGRRCMKKVTVNGTVTLHQRYLYRGYGHGGENALEAGLPLLFLLLYQAGRIPAGGVPSFR